MTFLPLDRITAGVNDRTAFPADQIRELAESVAAHGLAQPITVRPVDPDMGGERWEIVCGECRYRAHRLLESEGRSALGAPLGMIDAQVRVMSDREASAVMLLENFARNDPKPLDEAAAYAKRIADFGLTPAEVGQWAGKSTFRVSERLKLLSLTPEARKLVESTEAGALPVGHAARMAELDANRQALALAAWAESGGTISRVGWGEIVGRLMDEQSQETMFSADSFLQVADMVAGAAKREPSTKELRRLLAEAVRTMESAGVAPELCAEIRETYSAARNGRALLAPARAS